jgi:hypothetical protein
MLLLENINIGDIISGGDNVGVYLNAYNIWGEWEYYIYIDISCKRVIMGDITELGDIK